MVRIGDIAPDFTADSTRGSISLHKYMDAKKDHWLILFSHPKDFTPICTTEFISLVRNKTEFDKRNTLLLGYSVDSTKSHLEWIKDIQSVTKTTVEFPILDGKDRKIAKLYNMLDSSEKDSNIPLTVRSLFIIDPDKKVQCMFSIIYLIVKYSCRLSYPATTGRNIQEILRVLDSLQLLGTAANWKKGDAVIIMPKVSKEEAAEKYPEHSVVIDP